MTPQQLDTWLCFKFDSLAVERWLPLLANRKLKEVMACLP